MNEFRTAVRRPTVRRGLPWIGIAAFVIFAIVMGAFYLRPKTDGTSVGASTVSAPLPTRKPLYQPRISQDPTGYQTVNEVAGRWGADATLEQIRDIFDKVGYRAIERLDQQLERKDASDGDRVDAMFLKSLFYNYEGEPDKAYAALENVRTFVEKDTYLAELALYSVVFLEGVAGLRIGENENCILCRGESSCILPISKEALHTQPRGSRLAIKHFTEYLAQFPDDLEVKWLLNLAYMTLGEYPQQVDPKYRLSLDHYQNSEFDIGKFRDIGHLIGVNRFNQAGGAIMEDFDNDGLLDLVVTTFDPTGNMDFYRNLGNGTFENMTEPAGLTGQLGGLNCVQTDYNNDGHMDILVVRGAWLYHPIRPSLLKNNGDRTFSDVTQEAGLLHAVNSIAASWADYDNDGWLDLFVCCERQPNLLFHNLKDGTFEEVAAEAGVQLAHRTDCKGAAWFDFDNDADPDLYLSYVGASGESRLFRNDGDGTFRDVSHDFGIDPMGDGFSCWAFDYNNDGWLDIFATQLQSKMQPVIRGMLGMPTKAGTNRLYLNQNGTRFLDKTKEAGLAMAFAPMGSNFGDFDNDGYLDMYLGTGAPHLGFLVPNRMFRNVDGKRFADITASSRTGNLQKGHGIACGDWDRDGNIDLFAEMGGAVNGDQYHNIMFQNPGHDNSWLTVKLVGEKSNRAAIGARIKIVTAAEKPLTVHRHISSGSSFGGNPLQQTIGLAKADKIDVLEIFWPASRTTQTFRDVAINQAIEITEFAEQFRTLDWQPIAIPE